MKIDFKQLLIFIVLTCLPAQSLAYPYWFAADTPQFSQEGNGTTNQWGNVSFSVLANATNKWDHIDNQLRIVAAQKKREQQESHEKAQRDHQRQQEALQQEERACGKRRTEYKEKYLLAEPLEEWKLFDNVHQERRLRTLQNFDPARKVKRNYAVSRKTKNFINSYGNAQEHQQFRGNEFQQVLHQELLDIQAQAADLVVDKEYQDTIGSLGELAYQANKQGGVLFTSRLLDVCWGLLECGQAVAHGAKDGVFNTVDACCHPTRTAKQMAHGIVKTARAMAYVVKECGAISYYSMIDPEKLYNRVLTHKEQIEEVIEVVRSIPRYELIRCATAFGVEVVLLERAMGAIGQFSKYSYNNADKWLNVVSEAKETAGKWLDAAEKVSEYSFAVEGAPNIIVPTLGDYLNMMAMEAKDPVTKMHGNLVPALKGSATKWVALEEDLALLYMQFKGELIDIRPRHLFQPDIRTYTTKFGDVKKGFSGWHHDLRKAIFKNKKFHGYPMEIIKMERGKHGVYRFKWGMFGKEPKWSTFFPSDWTRQEVVKKILEARKSIEKYKIVFKKQPDKDVYRAVGYTKEGIRIRFVKNSKGKITTIFPEMQQKKVGLQ